MATRTITGTLLRPDGSAWYGAPVRFRLVDDTFRLSPDESYPILVIETTTDTDGEFSVTLVSGVDLVYEVTMPDRETFRILVEDGSATTLEVLRGLYGGIPTGVGTMVGPQGPAGISGTNLAIYYNVKEPPYNALGDGSNDDTAEIQAAIDAANTAGGGVVFLPKGTYKTSAALILHSNILLLGAGPGTVIKPTGTGFNVCSLTGTISSARLLASNAAEGTTAVTLVAGSVAALGLAVGDYVWLSDTVPSPGIDDTTNHEMVTTVFGIAGQVITLSDPLYESLATANAAQLVKLTPESGAGMRSLRVDGANLTNGGAPARGVLLNNTVSCQIDDCSFTNLLDAAIFFERGYGNSITRILMTRCGSASESDLMFSRQTSGEIHDILSQRATGFGPQLLFCNNCTCSDVRVVDAGGRGFKLHTASYCRLSNISVVNALYTGFGVTLGSHNNVVQGLLTEQCSNEGIWFHNNVDCRGNIITGAASLRNTSYELAFNAPCQYNYVEGFFDTTGFGVLQGGTNNVYTSLLTESGFRVSGPMLTHGPLAALGFALGSGGAVTQITSKATTVVLNKPTGVITTHNASLAAGGEVSFFVTNSYVDDKDIPVIVQRQAGTIAAYDVIVTSVLVGGFWVTISNLTAGALAEVLVLNFVIIKGVQA